MSDASRISTRKWSLLRQSLLVAASLAVLKAAVGIGTGSMGVLASALDSGLDFFVSLGNYLSVSVAERPPDRKHPYGYAKAEGLASLVQSTLIVLGAAAILLESARRLGEGAAVALPLAGAAVMAASMAASWWHGRRLNRMAKELQSTVFQAESLHFSVDAWSNLGVLTALVLVRATGSARWDLVVSIAVAFYIAFEGSKILKNSILELMDAAPALDTLVKIEDLIRGHHPSIVGFHDLRVRKAGSKHFVDFHIEIAGVDDFHEAHDITENLIDAVKARLPGADVTVHYDPKGAR